MVLKAIKYQNSPFKRFIILSYSFCLQETPQILKKRLPDMEKYKHVYPSQLFDDHPSFGVRDIANHVLGLLRKVLLIPTCA